MTVEQAVKKKWTAEEAMRRWPRLTAHVICQSLGYFTPTGAAKCIAHYKNGEPDFCEYVYHCFKGDPKPVIERAVAGRHFHKGYMADFKHAMRLVRIALDKGAEPLLASWF